jgi:nucleotide-binding universal stress UspA family protein
VGYIVVGVDGSPGSDHALRWASDEAELHGWRLRVVMAFEYETASVAMPPMRSIPEYREVEERARRALAETLREVPVGTRVEELVAEGSPSEVLLEAGQEAELIAVGSRGIGGFRGLLLGSVSRQVASRATVPAAVVPTWAGTVTRGRIVVGTDGSEAAAAALRWAAREAAVRDAQLEVVRVGDVARIPGPPGVVFSVEPEEELAAARQDAQRAVDEVLGPEPSVAVRVRGAVGHPTRQLLESAEEADLLVLGNRGRGRITDALLGSTSAGCVTHAPCPTVVVPSGTVEVDVPST